MVIDFYFSDPYFFIFTALMLIKKNWNNVIIFSIIELFFKNIWITEMESKGI